METAEKKVAQAALQEPSKIKMGGKTFKVQPPCIATLMKISSYVSQLPKMEISKDDYVGDTLRVAKDCGLMSDIITTMVLGARGKYPIMNAVLSLPHRIRYAFVRWFVENKVEPKDLQEAFVELLVNRMQTAFFLSVGTGLNEINTTRPTVTTAPMQ
jgi:hypothetical protein